MLIDMNEFRYWFSTRLTGVMGRGFFEEDRTSICEKVLVQNDTSPLDPTRWAK